MKGMTVIVKTITRLVIGFIFVFALYVILEGHLSPGGGFAGGTILACGFILLILSFGKDTVLQGYDEKLLTTVECFGAFGFILIALIGLTGGYFFKNFIGRGTPHRLISGGTVMYSNIMIGLKVVAGLFAVFLALVFTRIKEKK